MSNSSSQCATRAIVFCLLIQLIVPSAHGQEKAVRDHEDPNNPCGLIYTKHYGPFDYRVVTGKFTLVERWHFTPNVEALVRGESSNCLACDINYTLIASPNHTRALVAMERLSERTHKDQPDGAEFPMECYYDRALRFQPDDTVVRGLYALFLHKHSRNKEAINQLDKAALFVGDNAFSHYNIGLVYFEIRDYKKALIEAHTARNLGCDLKKLEELLRSVGKWRESTP